MKSTPSVAPERTWLVTPERTRFEVRADGPLVGEHRFGFRRYRAHVATTGNDASFHATIDVASLEGPFASIVRDRLPRSRALSGGHFRRHREAGRGERRV